MSDETRVSITYGDEISVSRDEFGLPAIKVQSRTGDEPPRWITCDVTGVERALCWADLAQAVHDLRWLPIEQSTDVE